MARDRKTQRERSRRYRATNPEKVRESQRRWRAANPEKVRESKRRYRAANPEKIKESYRRWYAANPEKGREKNFRTKYGMSSEEYDRKYEKQNGRCKICTDAGYEGPPQKLQVDHSHVSGINRDLLCNNHNTAVGNVHEDPREAGALAAYLGRWDTKSTRKKESAADEKLPKRSPKARQLMLIEPERKKKKKSS